MWPLFKASFLGRRFTVDELRRLWKVLQIKYTQNNANAAKDEIVCAMAKIGISIAFESEFVGARDIVQSAKNQYSGDGIWFPGERGERGRQYFKRLELERVQVYERLSSLEKTTTTGIVYELFGIKNAEKKKKVRLLNMLWTDIEIGDVSARTMMLLFPELSQGLDIKETKVSKKGLSRVRILRRDHVLLEPLEKAYWVDRKMNEMYRTNMSEVAVASMTTIPNLFVKLNEVSMRKTISLRRRSKACHNDQHRWDNWSTYKSEVIRSYLYGEIPASGM